MRSTTFPRQGQGKLGENTLAFSVQRHVGRHSVEQGREALKHMIEAEGSSAGRLRST